MPIITNDEKHISQIFHVHGQTRSLRVNDEELDFLISPVPRYCQMLYTLAIHLKLLTILFYISTEQSFCQEWQSLIKKDVYLLALVQICYLLALLLPLVFFSYSDSHLFWKPPLPLSSFFLQMLSVFLYVHKHK